MSPPVDASINQRHHLAGIWFGLSVLTAFAIPSSVLADVNSLETLVVAVSTKTDKGDYVDAAKLLRTLDAREIAIRIVESGNAKYLAVHGYSVIVPGIPSWRGQVAINDFRVVYIPATSDYSATKIESDFQNAAIEFAARFNLYVRHFAGEVDPQRGEVDLSSVQEALSLTDAEWKNIPLHAQLRIRNIIEALVECDKPVESRSKNRDR